MDIEALSACIHSSALLIVEYLVRGCNRQGSDCVPGRGHAQGACVQARTVSVATCMYVNRTRIRPTYGATYRMSFRLPVPKTNPEP